MTIGIAAFGPGAGLAVWRALRAVEGIGRGAIGGFVSLVVLREDRAVLRADTQRSGALGLFAGDEPPPEISAARWAGLISSGPDRPEPLSQFTPADGAVGLVTGHRLPNLRGGNGQPLNEAALGLMRDGRSPREALRRVLGDNPHADTGLIALDRRGRIWAEDARFVHARGERGKARLGSARGGAVVAVLHNSILPHRPVADLAAAVALDTMRPTDRVDGTVTLTAGVPVVLGERPAWVLDAAGRLQHLEITLAHQLEGRWGLGLGWRVAVRRAGKPWGQALYEPFMVIEDARLVSLDGRSRLDLPVTLTQTRS